MIGKRLISVLLAVFALVAAYGQDTSVQENKKARLEKEIAIIDAQLKETSTKSTSALTQLNLIRTNIENRKALVAESDREIARIDGQIKECQREIDKIQGRLDTLSAYYSKLVRSAYKNRDAKVWYMYVLASDNVGQAFRRLGYLRTLSSRMNTQAEKISRTKAELEAEKEKLTLLREDAKAARDLKAQEVKNLQKEEAKAKSLVDTLNKQKSKYQKELSAKRKQVEALNKEIERLIREATAPPKQTSKNKNTKAKPKTEIDEALDAEFAKNKGKLPWPADGPIVDKYGQRNHPVYTNIKLPFNSGIGIAVEPGTKVKAVFDGEVKKIVVMAGYNQCVLVQHGNYFSLYCKLKSVSVKAGDKVKTGQEIGVVDTIGDETQVHLQIWKGSTPQNPELWLKP